MRNYLLITVAIIAIIVCSPRNGGAQPQPKSFGFGLILGDPTGLTLKGSLGGNNSWDAAIGSSWFGSIRIHGDYLWAADVFNSRKAGLYFGLGGVIGFGNGGGGVLYKGEKGRWYYSDEDRIWLGVRGSAGVNFMPFSAPVEIFGEIAPIIGLTPVTGVGWDAALGIRYYP